MAGARQPPSFLGKNFFSQVHTDPINREKFIKNHENILGHVLGVGWHLPFWEKNFFMHTDLINHEKIVKNSENILGGGIGAGCAPHWAGSGGKIPHICSKNCDKME